MTFCTRSTLQIQPVAQRGFAAKVPTTKAYLQSIVLAAQLERDIPTMAELFRIASCINHPLKLPLFFWQDVVDLQFHF